MKTTARSTSTFSRSGLPPFAGIARMPLIACSTAVFCPNAITLPHAALSPTFGDPASPVS
jgi:hypothetical protein